MIIMNSKLCYGLNLIMFNENGAKENPLIAFSLEDVKKSYKSNG
jgi:hypothetical protein